MSQPHDYVLAHFIKYVEKYSEAVKVVGKTFLSGKGQTLDNYISYIQQPGNHGDELSLHLCAHCAKSKLLLLPKQVFGIQGN